MLAVDVGVGAGVGVELGVELGGAVGVVVGFVDGAVVGLIPDGVVGACVLPLHAVIARPVAMIAAEIAGRKR